jgi:hypothetical protein
MKANGETDPERLKDDKHLGLHQFDEEEVEINEDGRRRVRRIQKASFSLDDLFRNNGNPVDMYDLADLLILPIINVDGYINLGSRNGKSDWNKAKMKRKNHNISENCS